LDIGLLQTDRSWFDTRLPSLLLSSRNSNTIGQDLLTEVGHSVDGGIFQALHWFVLSICYSMDTTREHDYDQQQIP